MAEKKHVKIDDYNATIDYDFPFKKYEQVLINDDGHTGTVVDAEWIGEDQGSPFYTVTYWVKSNVDSSVREFTLNEIRDLNRNRN